MFPIHRTTIRSWLGVLMAGGLPAAFEIEIVHHPSGERTVLKGHQDQINDVRWNSSGTLLASGGLDATVRIWSIAEGQEINRIESDSPIQALAWDPTGNFLAVSDHFNRIRIRDLRSDKWIASLTGHSRSVHTLSWSPDGKRLASGSVDHSIRIWDMDNFDLVAVMSQHTRSVIEVDWSPDGRKLVSAGEDKIIVWESGGW